MHSNTCRYRTFSRWNKYDKNDQKKTNKDPFLPKPLFHVSVPSREFHRHNSRAPNQRWPHRNLCKESRTKGALRIHEGGVSPLGDIDPAMGPFAALQIDPSRSRVPDSANVINRRRKRNKRTTAPPARGHVSPSNPSKNSAMETTRLVLGPSVRVDEGMSAREDGNIKESRTRRSQMSLSTHEQTQRALLCLNLSKMGDHLKYPVTFDHYNFRKWTTLWERRRSKKR